MNLAVRLPVPLAAAASIGLLACGTGAALAHGDDPLDVVDAAPSTDAAPALPPMPDAVVQPRMRPVVRPAATPTLSPVLGGSWSEVRDWPLVAIHAALLPNGKVLAWDATPDDSDDDPHTTDNYTTRVTLWDPSDDTHVETNNDTDSDLFCAGSAHLWDGRLLFAGGDGGRAGANGPLPNTNVYEPSTNTWRRTVNMNAPRWYSSVAALGNGEMLTFGGTYDPVPIGEVFRFDRTWRPLDGLQTPPGYDAEGMGDYQWMQNTPDGSVIVFGPQNLLAGIDARGSGRFDAGPLRDDAGVRDYGSYAMFDVGKILVSGGGNSVDTAVVIDTATRQSTDTGRMNTGRRQHNLTILADGSVLVTGGNDDGSELVSTTGAVFTPELWDPATGAFRELNPMNADRQYHSVALLLADGRVLSGGGGICGRCYEIGYEERNAAVFTPPYLYSGDASLAPRPALLDVPARADYGSRITVGTEAGSDIVRAHLIKLGSATHSQNQDQRLVPLVYSRSGDSLVLDLPRSRDVAPPGHYLLFIVDADGVPSTGAFLRLGQPLVEPGEAFVGALEPGAWENLVMPVAAGSLSLTLTADAPVELYVSSAGPTRSTNIEQADCRAAAAGAREQRCTVSADVDTAWHVTVHGGARTDFRLDSVGIAAPASIADPPVSPSSPLPGETRPGEGGPGEGGPADPAVPGDSSGAGDGAGPVASGPVKTGGSASFGLLLGLLVAGVGRAVTHAVTHAVGATLAPMGSLPVGPDGRWYTRRPPRPVRRRSSCA